MPLVSVIIPTYNRGHLIERAVQSALQQSHRNLEVIIVDDASTDNTNLVVQKLLYSDRRVKYICHFTNCGAQAARNSGIRIAQGGYLAFLDSDDEWLPTKIGKQLSIFNEKNRFLGVVYTGTLSDRGSLYMPHLKGKVHKETLSGVTIPFSPLMIKKQYLEEIGFLKEDLPAWQDDDTCVRLSRICEFDYVPEPLVIMHDHEGLKNGGSRISKTKQKYALGALLFINYHRSNISRYCGRRLLGKRLIYVGQYFLDANDIDNAKRLFIDSCCTWPFSFSALYYAAGSFLYPKRLGVFYAVRRKIGRLTIGIDHILSKKE